MRNEYANRVRVFLHIITVLSYRAFLYTSIYIDIVSIIRKRLLSEDPICSSDSSTTVIVNGIYSKQQSANLSCATVLQICYATNYASTPACIVASCFIQNFGNCSHFSEHEENVWPSISCLFQAIGTLTEEDRQCDWFRVSHKGYRNFTKMSAKCQQNRSTPRIQAAFGSKKSSNAILVQ